jgi:hypothetical protein
MHHNNRFQLNNSWFCNVYQSKFRTRAQNAFHLSRKALWTRLNTDFLNFFQIYCGGYELFGSHKKMCWRNVSSLSIGAPQGVCVSTVPLWKIEVALYLENIVLGDIHWYKPFFLFRCVEFTPKLCPSNTDTPCICKTFLTLKCHLLCTHCMCFVWFPE